MMPTRRQRLDSRTVIIVSAALAAGLAFTAIATRQVIHNHQLEAQAIFDRLTERLHRTIQSCVQRSTYGLHGLRGVYVASVSVEREEFKSYVESRDLPGEFPGVQGMGYIQRVPHDELDAFVAATRADGAPDFQVHLGDRPSEPANDVDTYYIVKHIVPLDPNREAVGSDITTNSVIFTTAIHAAQTGKSTISPRVMMTRDGRTTAGFYILVPIYRNGANSTTPEERMAALQGLVYAPVLLDEALVSTLESVDRKVEFELHEGDTVIAASNGFATKERIAFAYDESESDPRRDAQFESQTQLEVLGRNWTLTVRNTPQFNAGMHQKSTIVLGVGGTVLSLMFAATLWSLLTSGTRASELATTMTTDLSKARDDAEVALKEIRSLRTALDDHSIISVTDRNGRIIEVNERFCEISGYTADELIGNDHRMINSTTHPKGFWTDMWRTIARGDAWRAEVCNRRKDGSLYWVDSTIIPFFEIDGKLQRCISIRFDITSRKEAEEALRITTDRLMLATRAGGVGIWEYECQSQSLDWDDQMFGLFGMKREQAASANDAWKTGVHCEDIARIDQVLRDVISNEGEVDFDEEFRVVWPDGEMHTIHALAVVRRNTDGQAINVTGTSWDVTDQKRSESLLRDAARIDKLTGLPNRTLLRLRIENALARHERDPAYRLALLFMDFDRFKLINDTLGHAMGDELLRQIAGRLRETIRAVDSTGSEVAGNTAARLGGDEFVILAEGVRNASEAQAVADRLLRVCNKPFMLGDLEIFASASIGIALCDDESADADLLIADADTAMYEAKINGKNQSVLFNATMRTRLQKRAMLERDLRDAVTGEQLSLLYQPIVDMESGSLHSVEALVRWNHPTDGVVSPAEFIPIAEETGLIIPIGDWVLREACRQFVDWKHVDPIHAPRSISVNLSRNQLSLSDLPARLASIFEETGIDAAEVHLEITESTVMQDVESTKATLKEIKALGVKIDMDDFGTGYSSLSCLHEFCFDTLKIDRAFTMNISVNHRFGSLVHAIVELATNLNMQVVAEGVETLEQLAVLQALDCKFAQGYFFSRPTTANEVLAYRPPDMTQYVANVA